MITKMGSIGARWPQRHPWTSRCRWAETGPLGRFCEFAPGHELKWIWPNPVRSDVGLTENLVLARDSKFEATKPHPVGDTDQ